MDGLSWLGCQGFYQAVEVGLSAWLAQLTGRAHANVAAVALANKLARITWAVLAKDEPYRPAALANDRTLTGLQMSPG